MRDYDSWESSLLWHMQQIRSALLAARPDVSAMTLIILDSELDQFRQEVLDADILVKFSLGPTNPTFPHTSKDYRIIQFSVEYRGLKNREHCVVINTIYTQWQPGLSFRMWNTNGSDTFINYTETTPAWIQDLRDGAGYNGSDGRYVLPFALDLKYPKL